MVALIGIISTFFGSVVASVATKITMETVKLVLWKAFLLFLVTVVCPIVLYNVLSDFIFDIIVYAINYISDQEISPITIQLTGFAGYIGNQINIQGVIAMYMSAVAVRFQLAILRIF